MRICVWFVAATLCLPASAQGTLSDWTAVEQVVPGEVVDLRQRTTGVVSDCVVADITESTLTCDEGGPYGQPRRIVYAQSGIDRVWVVRWGHGVSGRALAIGAGIGALFGGLAGGRAGAGPAAVGVGLGALVGTGIASSNSGTPWHVVRRRIPIYKVR